MRVFSITFVGAILFASLVSGKNIPYLERGIVDKLNQTRSPVASIPTTANFAIAIFVDSTTTPSIWGTTNFHSINPFSGNLYSKQIVFDDQPYLIVATSDEKIVLNFGGQNITYSELQNGIESFVNKSTVSGRYIAENKDIVEFQENGVLLINNNKVGTYSINVDSELRNNFDLLSITFLEKPDRCPLGNTYFNSSLVGNKSQGFYGFRQRGKYLDLLSVRPILNKEGFEKGRTLYILQNKIDTNEIAPPICPDELLSIQPSGHDGSD